MSWTEPIHSYHPTAIQLQLARELDASRAPIAEAAAKVARMRIQVNDSRRHTQSVGKYLDQAIRRNQSMRTLRHQADLDKSRKKLIENKQYLDQALAEYYALGGRSMVVLHGWTP